MNTTLSEQDILRCLDIAYGAGATRLQRAVLHELLSSLAPRNPNSIVGAIYVDDEDGGPMDGIVSGVVYWLRQMFLGSDFCIRNLWGQGYLLVKTA